MNSFKGQAFIPAAGWGTRVGSPPSKELFPHPLYPGKTFIEVALERCWNANLKAWVITRSDKKVLIDWCEKFARLHRVELQAENPKLGLLQIEPKPQSEWVDTLLCSSHLWTERNLLLLPDAEFAPLSLLNELIQDLDEVEFGLALHWVNQPELWGIYDSKQGLIEKPGLLTGMQKAWGLLAWRGGETAIQFWQSYALSRKLNRAAKLPQPYKTRELNLFADLTR